MTFQEFCMEFDLTLDQEQKEAVLRTEGPCLVQAVPGSGKTTVLTARLGYMGCCLETDLSRVLVMTFSKDAAEVMRERFRTRFGGKTKGQPTFCTIHSLAFRIIREYCRKYGREPFRILTDSEKVIKDIVKKQCDEMYWDLASEEAAGRISQALNGAVVLSADEEDSRYGVDWREIFGSYKRMKLQEKQMDFDDLLVYGLRILKKCPEICHALQNRFDHFCVDEFQDSSPIQNEILKLLADKAKSLFLVGDEDQSIYGFRGADPEYMHRFAKEFGPERVLRLENNYRSSQAVISVAGKLIRQNRGRTPKDLKGVRQEAGSVRVRRFKDLREREDHLLEDLTEQSDAAVLARNNESLIGIAYRMYLEGIPFIPTKGMKDFFFQEPIGRILEIFRCVTEKKDSDSIPKSMQKYLSNESLIRCLSAAEPVNALYLLVDQMGFGRYIKGKWGEKNMSRIYMKLDILAGMMAPHPDLEDFMKGLDGFMQELASSDETEGIRLLTCHGAKGMEFEKVYLIDLVDKIFPSCYYITDGSSKEYEEEVRLLYVALTRAKNEAEILQAENYRWGRFAPSIFAKEIEEMIDE